MRKLRAVWLVVVCSLAPGLSAVAGEFESAVYAPIEPGQYSTFSLPGFPDETGTIQEGFETVNSISTRVEEYAGGEFPGSRSNLTNDEEGFRLHRAFLPDVDIPGFPLFDRTVTFTPPAVELPASFDLGGVVQSQGTVRIVDSDGFRQTVDYDYTATIDRIEEVSVPFGTFQAIRVDQILVLDGQDTETSTEWYAAGLGSVKYEDTSESPPIVSELLDTNRTYVPEPGALALHCAAISTLALLGARRRCPTSGR